MADRVLREALEGAASVCVPHRVGTAVVHLNASSYVNVERVADDEEEEPET